MKTYKTPYHLYNTETHDFDYSDVSFFNLNARKEELAKIDASKTTFGQWVFMKRELAAIREEWNKRVHG